MHLICTLSEEIYESFDLDDLGKQKRLAAYLNFHMRNRRWKVSGSGEMPVTAELPVLTVEELLRE